MGVRDWQSMKELRWLGLFLLLSFGQTSGCNSKPENTSQATNQNVERDDRQFEVARLPNNPILRTGMPGLDESEGSNINGPSLIRVPEWIANPLGKYYLYFANHRGSYIRLAYADKLEGPWTIYPNGTLHLNDTKFDDHMASPDVHVDEHRRKIVMYYHGRKKNRPANWQSTRVAFSSDGLHFKDNRPAVDLGESYFRVFRWRGDYYAVAWAGEFYKAMDPIDPWKDEWETGVYPINYPGAPIGPVLRHAAVQLKGDLLNIFYSNISDAPEHILMSTIRLTNDWRSWHASEPMSVLKPEMEYEGADLPIRVSFVGAAQGPVHELRDPAIFEEEGRSYLLYSVSGESGIAIAEIKERP